MSTDEPIATGASAELERAWMGRLAQLGGLVVLTGALFVRSGSGVFDSSTLGTRVLIVFVVGVFLFVLARVRRVRANVAKARPGSEVLVGYGTPYLGATLAACGIKLRGVSSSRALVALVFTSDTLEVVARKRARSLIVVDWSDVTSVSMGRCLLGGRQQPTVQIDIFNAARIAVIPAAGAWWSTLLPTKDVTTGLVQGIEAIRQAAGERAAADIQA